VRPDRYLLLSLCLLSGFLASTAGAGARFEIKPFLNLSTSYESNYFQTETNERGIIEYAVAPGLDFGLRTEKSEVALRYYLKSNWYGERGATPQGAEKASKLDYLEQDLAITAGSQVTDRLRLSLTESFYVTRDPDKLDPYSNSTLRNKYYRNLFTPDVFYSFSEKFGIGLSYRSGMIDQSESSFEDSSENRLIARTLYNLNSLNSLTLEYQAWNYDYTMDTPDYSADQVMLLFNRALKYYTLTAGIGYQERSFDVGKTKEFDDCVWLLQIKGDRPKMLFALSRSLNDSAFDDEYFLATRFDAEFGRLFLEKLDVRFKGYYQSSDYMVGPRQDSTYSISCSVDYQRSHYFTLGLEGGYEIRDSNVDRNDYDGFFLAFTLRFTPKPWNKN
jgi:hypothetical protein